MRDYAETTYDGDERVEAASERGRSSQERHEQIMKSIMLMGESIERLQERLEDVLLPDTPRATQGEDGMAKMPDKPMISRLQKQHMEAMAGIRAQTRKLEALVERIDL